MAPIKRTAAFSLIELIVAIGVFTTVATIAVGALLTLSSVQKKAFYIQTNQDNVRFALETMGREIRTGGCYRGDTSPNTVCQDVIPPLPANACTGPLSTSCFQFRSALGDDVVYKKSAGPDVISQNNCGIIPFEPGFTVSCITKLVDRHDGIPPQFYPVTAREVQIQSLEFRVFGEDPALHRQPRVTIFMKAQTPDVSVINTQLDVQTTISQHKFEINP